MTQVTVQTTIRAPRNSVFSVFANIVGAVESVPSIKRCEMLTEGAVGVGTRWKETREIFGQQHTEEMEIVDFVPQSRYAVATHSHGTHYETQFIFQQEEEGTQVTMIFSTFPQTLLAKAMGFFMGFMMTGAVRRLLEEDLESLKKACETQQVGTV